VNYTRALVWLLTCITFHSLTPDYISCCGLQAVEAFKRFTAKIAEVDQLIKDRNADKTLKNRYGVVNMPYQLLRPRSNPGMTSMGVPNSITI